MELFSYFSKNDQEPENILPRDGEVFYFPNFFSLQERELYFKKLLQEIEWQQQAIVIFGRRVMQPRLTAWYGESEGSYGYSGLKLKTLPWTKTLREIKARVETQCGVSFTHVLLNQYRNEKDSMGWHRDNEKELGLEPVIASVSLGEEREFQMRHYHEKSLKRSVKLQDGSLLLMRGRTQECWEHALPKRSQSLGIRLNLTFRVIKDS